MKKYHTTCYTDCLRTLSGSKTWYSFQQVLISYFMAITETVFKFSHLPANEGYGTCCYHGKYGTAVTPKAWGLELSRLHSAAGASACTCGYSSFLLKLTGPAAAIDEWQHHVSSLRAPLQCPVQQPTSKKSLPPELPA